jgi:hypothetical protein
MNAANTWVTANPFWVAVIETVLGGLLAAWVTLSWPTIKGFLALPPQHLNIRILKAQILAAETKIVWNSRIQGDTRYLVFSCFNTLIRWGSSLAMICVTALFILLGRVHTNRRASTINAK